MFHIAELSGINLFHIFQKCNRKSYKKSAEYIIPLPDVDALGNTARIRNRCDDFQKFIFAVI